MILLAEVFPSAWIKNQVTIHTIYSQALSIWVWRGNSGFYHVTESASLSQLFKDDRRFLLEKLSRWKAVLRDHLCLQVLKITTFQEEQLTVATLEGVKSLAADKMNVLKLWRITSLKDYQESTK